MFVGPLLATRSASRPSARLTTTEQTGATAFAVVGPFDPSELLLVRPARALDAVSRSGCLIGAYAADMGRYGTRADMIVHEEQPFNAESGPPLWPSH